MNINFKESLKSATEQGAKLAALSAEKFSKGTAELKEELDKAAAKSVEKVSRGLEETKAGIESAAKTVQAKSKETQMQVLSYVDKQKNKKFLEAKMSAFEDGLKQGKIETVDYIKKLVDYYLAITALSYYFARCDGSIDETELAEVKRDLEGILKNKDLPKNIKVAMITIAEKEDLSFEDVKKYLDNVSCATLEELLIDIDEIVTADGEINEAERTAKSEYIEYLRARQEMSHGE